MKLIFNNKFIFFLFLAISVLPVFLYKFIPSLDGSHHLANSQIIIQLLKNNELFQNYYSFNEIIAGNSLGQFLLVIFNFIVPAFIAEKLLFLIYLIGIPLSFRMLIKEITGTDNPLVILIFPFSHTTLFYFGYYNFSLSFILLFVIVALWLRNDKNPNWKNYILLTVLFTLLFFSHIIVLGFAGLVLGLYILYQFFSNGLKKSFKQEIKPSIIKMGLVFIISIPAIILGIIYILKSPEIGSSIASQSNLRETLLDIFEIRSLIVYSRPFEAPTLIALFILVFTIFITGIYDLANKNAKNFDLNNFFSERRFWLILFLIVLSSYILIPEKIGVGAMKMRLSILMFFILLVCINTLNFSSRLINGAVFFALIVFVFQIHNKHQFIAPLSKKAAQIAELEKAIDKNSTILCYNFSQNWIEIHFGSYLGTDKEILNLYNPQAWGPFPIIYKNRNIPKTTYKNNDRIVLNVNSPHSQPISPDYVFLWKDHNFNQDKNREQNPELYICLNKDYELVKSTDNKFGDLYKKKNK